MYELKAIHFINVFFQHFIRKTLKLTSNATFRNLALQLSMFKGIRLT